MYKNHKVISNLTKSTCQHKFHESKNWNKFENSEIYDDMLYFLRMQDYLNW